MRAKKPRNKKYVPKPMLADPVGWAVAGSHKMPTEAVEAAMAPSKEAMTLIRQGKATREDWNMVCQMLNLGETLAAAGVGMNLVPDLKAGQEALEGIAKRMIGGKTTACYSREIKALDEALIMFQAQLQVCTQAEWGRALQRLRQLHASGAMRDVGKLYGQMVVEHATQHAATP